MLTMAEMLSFAILLHLVITHVTNTMLTFPIEMPKNVIDILLSYSHSSLNSMSLNTINTHPLSKVNLLSSPFSSSDFFGPLAILMWGILKNI